MDYQSLKGFQEGLWKTQGLFSWSFTESRQLLDTNCPEQELFFEFFRVGGASRVVGEYF